ncbi:MAG: hypothetical protein JSW46_04915 [Gemmatimonadota bacterium]|nr:MAG: hypothetical protein JSW46_04915 [Gemmatimonadota bacterium]
MSTPALARLFTIRLLLSALACVAALGVAVAEAGPDLRRPRNVGSLIVFPDDRRPDLFYYRPGDLHVVADDSGRPDFQFLEMRYTGTATAGDQGLQHFRSVLSFRVRMAQPAPSEIRAAREALAPRGGTVELRPLPIRRLEAIVVYAAPGGSPHDETAPRGEVLPPGNFEATDQRGRSSSGAYWTERVYTIRLEPAAAQLFRLAFERDWLVLSVGYAFFADGVPPEQTLAELSGSPELVEAFGERLRSDDTEGEDAQGRGHLVHAGTFPVRIDAERWPDLLKRIDLNEQAPPGYPILEVYCYDFRDAIRPDLAARRVELEADGVGGRPVAVVLHFTRANPDLYMQRVRFPFAVRLDRSYDYRVTDILTDGQVVEGLWQERWQWAAILDVTTGVNPDSM